VVNAYAFIYLLRERGWTKTSVGGIPTHTRIIRIIYRYSYPYYYITLAKVAVTNEFGGIYYGEARYYVDSFYWGA